MGERNACMHNPANNLTLEAALFAYDTLLTLPHEVHYIWNQRFKLGTILYLLARYAALLSLAMTATTQLLLNASLQVCLFDDSLSLT